MSKRVVANNQFRKLVLRNENFTSLQPNFLFNLRGFHSASLLNLEQSASSIFDSQTGIKHNPTLVKPTERANWDLYDASTHPILKDLIDSQKSSDAVGLSASSFANILKLGLDIKNSKDSLQIKKNEHEIIKLCLGDARNLYKYCILAYTLSKRLDHGISDVLLLLGICIKYGAVEADYTNASVLYEGIQGIQNKKEGLATMKRLADKGLKIAIVKFGSMLLDEGQLNEAIYYLKTGAKHGSAEANLILGHVHNNEKYGLKDTKEALSFFEASAEKGSQEAHFYLGLVKQEMETPDFKDVISHYEKAAASGIAEAQYNLGLIYFSGNGSSKNYNLAMEYWEMASNQNFSPAMINLAKIHLEKTCPKSSPEEGIALLRHVKKVFKGQEVEKHADAILSQYPEKKLEAKEESSGKDQCIVM